MSPVQSRKRQDPFVPWTICVLNCVRYNVRKTNDTRVVVWICGFPLRRLVTGTTPTMPWITWQSLVPNICLSNEYSFLVPSLKHIAWQGHWNNSFLVDLVGCHDDQTCLFPTFFMPTASRVNAWVQLFHIGLSPCNSNIRIFFFLLKTMYNYHEW